MYILSTRLQLSLSVVTVTASDASDSFPSASYAFTLTVYSVPASSPLTVHSVSVTSAFSSPSTKTLYPVTSVSSVDSFHDTVMLSSVLSPTFRSVGADGGVTSPSLTVVKSADALSDLFPAASTASTDTV